MDKGSNTIMFVDEIKNFMVKWLFFPKLRLFKPTWLFEMACQALSLNIG